MGHRNGVVSISRADVEDDHRRSIVGCCVADLVLTRAVPVGDQSDPGSGLRWHEAGIGVAGLAVVRGGGQDHHPLSVLLGRVLPVAATLRLLAAQLRCHRVLIGDVDEGGVPFLPLSNGEIQAQKMHEAEGEQPGREGQAPAGRHKRARSHGELTPATANSQIVTVPQQQLHHISFHRAVDREKNPE